MSATTRQDVTDALIEMIAADLERSISNLGYPVGMGIAPPIELCRQAAATIIGRISHKALALLAERAEP